MYKGSCAYYNLSGHIQINIQLSGTLVVKTLKVRKIIIKSISKNMVGRPGLSKQQDIAREIPCAFPYFH